MAPRDEDLKDEEPPSIEPYTVLGIDKTATADEIKKAYRKAALKHHPDKATTGDKEAAHTRFQEIAFAYAVLSDDKRRKRYDATGSTSESIDIDGFSWSDFYSSQYEDIVTDETIKNFSKSYKGSDEEKDDVLNAYTKSKGKWSGIYQTVMLSDPLEDEDRFRSYIDEAIENGDVQGFKVYTQETEKLKETRMKNARKEAEREGKEAMEWAKKSGLDEKLFCRKNNEEDALAAIIKKRQEGRNGFLDRLEEKYAAPEKPKGKSGKGKKRASEEEDVEDGMPSEEAFQAAAARLKGDKAGEGGRKPKRTKH